MFLAEAALSASQINEKKISQSIIISGLTGAGKTESAKNIIEFLCQKSAYTVNIPERILSSNTILELFGNAETLGNRNSSRFCKFIQVRFYLIERAIFIYSCNIQLTIL